MYCDLGWCIVMFCDLWSVLSVVFCVLCIVCCVLCSVVLCCILYSVLCVVCSLSCVLCAVKVKRQKGRKAEETFGQARNGGLHII